MKMLDFWPLQEYRRIQNRLLCEYIVSGCLKILYDCWKAVVSVNYVIMFWFSMISSTFLLYKMCPYLCLEFENHFIMFEYRSYKMDMVWFGRGGLLIICVTRKHTWFCSWYFMRLCVQVQVQSVLMRNAQYLFPKCLRTCDNVRTALPDRLSSLLVTGFIAYTTILTTCIS